MEERKKKKRTEQWSKNRATRYEDLSARPMTLDPSIVPKENREDMHLMMPHWSQDEITSYFARCNGLEVKPLSSVRETAPQSNMQRTNPLNGALQTEPEELPEMYITKPYKPEPDPQELEEQRLAGERTDALQARTFQNLQDAFNGFNETLMAYMNQKGRVALAADPTIHDATPSPELERVNESLARTDWDKFQGLVRNDGVHSDLFQGIIDAANSRIREDSPVYPGVNALSGLFESALGPLMLPVLAGRGMREQREMGGDTDEAARAGMGQAALSALAGELAKGLGNGLLPDDTALNRSAISPKTLEWVRNALTMLGQQIGQNGVEAVLEWLDKQK